MLMYSTICHERHINCTHWFQIFWAETEGIFVWAVRWAVPSTTNCNLCQSLHKFQKDLQVKPHCCSVCIPGSELFEWRRYATVDIERWSNDVENKYVNNNIQGKQNIKVNRCLQLLCSYCNFLLCVLHRRTEGRSCVWKYLVDKLDMVVWGHVRL